MTDATVTFDLLTALGVPFDATRTKVWLTFNTDEGWIVDATGAVRMDAGTATITSAGLVTITGIPVPSGSTNPTDFQVKVHFDAPVVLPGVRSLKRKTGDFGWMTVTADADLTDLIAEQYVPPTWLTTAQALLQGYVDEGADLLAAQIALSEIGTSDSLVSALILGTAGAGPLTRSALSASIDARVPVASTSAQGKVELATNAEAAAGADAARGLTPAGLRYALANGQIAADQAVTTASIVDGRAVAQQPAIRAATVVASFISDDCPIEDRTQILPIMQAANVPWAQAFPSQYPGLAGLCAWSDITYLRDQGVQHIAHSKNHTSLVGLSTADKILQINNLADYAAQGITVRGIAYPNGAHDAEVRKISRDYYPYAFGTVTGASGSQAPLRTYAIRRIAIKDSTVTADHYAQIDTAIANGEWIVFYFHANPTAAEFTSAGGGYARLAAVIAYLQSHSVPIVLPSVAFDMVKNRMDHGDVVGGTKYAVLDGAGGFYAPGLEAAEFVSYGDPFALTAATLPDAYPGAVVTISDIASTITDWPNGANVGMVFTDTVHRATSRAFVNQLYVSNGLMWHRRAQSGSNAWNSWTQIGPASPAPGSVTTIAAAPSTYAAGVTITTLLSPSTGSPRPGTGPGTVETVIAVPGTGVTTGSLNFQRFTSSGGTYVRQGANDNTGWGGWYEIPRSQIAIAAVRDFPSIAAGGQQELTVACVGAVGDTVLLGPPAALEAGLVATARVTATNTVTIRLSNITASAIDPASASWTVRVLATPV